MYDHKHYLFDLPYLDPMKVQEIEYLAYELHALLFAYELHALLFAYEHHEKMFDIQLEYYHLFVFFQVLLQIK